MARSRNHPRYHARLMLMGRNRALRSAACVIAFGGGGLASALHHATGGS